MLDRNPKQRIADLESAFARMEQDAMNHFQESDPRIKAATDRTEALQCRLEDLDRIEKMLVEAYAETHPKADRDLLAVTQATDRDFINFPSVRAMRDRR